MLMAFIHIVAIETRQITLLVAALKFVYLGTRRHPEWVFFGKVLSKVLLKAKVIQTTKNR